MKKTIISILTAVLAVSTLTHTSIASAEEEISQSAPSKATVIFKAPTEPVAPLNPDKLEELLDTDKHDGNNTSQRGPLSLDYVSNFSFGNESNPLEITSKTMHYESLSPKPFVQVSDFRGTGEGWNLKVSASPFKSKENNTLIGATISLVEGSIESPDLGVRPQLQFKDNSTTAGEDRIKKAAIEIPTTETAVQVAIADANEEGKPLSEAPGQGTWLMKWYSELTEDNKNPNVLLTVIGNTASPGTHTSEITWTLENGPGVR